MATCYKCNQEIAPDPRPGDNSLRDGYVSPKSDALWLDEALEKGDGRGPDTTKEYPACPACYRLDWREVYPDIPCPI